jgi:hypothetical protein
MILTSNIKITKIIKTTKARLFSNVKVGDIVRAAFEVNNVGRNNGSLYASYIKVLLERDKPICETFSVTELSKYLSCFEYEQISQ